MKPSGDAVKTKVYDFMPDIWEKGVNPPAALSSTQDAKRQKERDLKYLDAKDNPRIGNAYNRDTVKNAAAFNSSGKGRVDPSQTKINKSKVSSSIKATNRKEQLVPTDGG